MLCIKPFLRNVNESASAVIVAASHTHIAILFPASLPVIIPRIRGSAIRSNGFMSCCLLMILFSCAKIIKVIVFFVKCENIVTFAV